MSRSAAVAFPYGNHSDISRVARGERSGAVATINSATAQYAYDGDGRRVKKVSGGATTVYVYDAQGQLAAEYATAGNPAPPCLTCYLTADHLGSTRLVSDGHTVCKKRYDYRPFGEDIPVGIGDRSTNLCYGGTDPTTIRFTGKERDTETVSSTTEGLDFFEARYFSSAQGRFNSPDPVMITPDRLRDPQQLNRYAYARNNPLRFTDPSGQELRCTGDADSQAACFEYLKLIAGDSADRLSMNDAGAVAFDSSGIDLSASEGATLINELVVSNNIYGLTIGDTAQTQGGPQSVDLASNLPPAFDQFGLVKGRPGKPMLTQLPLSPLTDQVTINPNAPIHLDERDRPVSTSSYVFHELAEAYAKIDKSQPYSPSLVVNNGFVMAGFLDPGAHAQAGVREDIWRQQRPSLKGTGRAADQLIVDPQAHPRPRK